MLRVSLICVGKLKEKFFEQACGEYIKRLGAYCRLEVFELQERRLPDKPSQSQLTAALEAEAKDIKALLTGGIYVAALCVEGEETDSPGLAEIIRNTGNSGGSGIAFIVGGSNGLDERLKKQADIRFSMSRLTFPHHLARVMLLEQIYRAFTINSGGKYHK